MNEKDLKIYTQLMKTRFMEDPGVKFQLGDLERAELLIGLQFEGQIEAFMTENAVSILDDGRGLLIGYSTKEFPEEKLFEVMQHSSRKLMEEVTETEFQLLQEKALQEVQIIPQNWHVKYLDGDVYHLLTIAIDKKLKGTGAFRELIMPLIDDCEAKELPLILETFNSENLPIYEHFGFKLMESHASDEIGLTCYCMMRLDQSI